MIALQLPGKPWDDLVIPATSVNPVGLPSPPTQDSTDGCWRFGAGANNVVTFVWQLPHSWWIDSDVHPHLHWWKVTSAAGTVNWRLDWRFAPIGAVAGGYVGATAGTVRIADADTAFLTAIREWTIVAPTLGISGCILATLTRQSAAGGDSYAADAKLISADLHIRHDALGSRTEYVK